MIADKLTFSSTQIAVIVPARTTPAQTTRLAMLDFGKVIWEDDQGKQTLSARSVLFGNVVIMAVTAKTPYNPNWAEQDARVALVTQLGVPQVSAPSAPAPAAASPAVPVPAAAAKT
jgi:hypothetical protein